MSEDKDDFGKKHAGWITALVLAMLAGLFTTSTAPMGGLLAMAAALGVGLYVHWALNN